MRRLLPWLMFGALSAPLIGGGIYTFVKSRAGEPAQATVRNCERSYRGAAWVVTCTGTWVRGGSLLEGGRVDRGTIEGADYSHLGETIDVRLSGGRAYATGIATPLVLFSMGVAVLGFGAWLIRKGSAAPGTPAAP